MNLLSQPNRFLGIALLGLLATTALGDKAAPLGALAKMPVKEITIFKDGHALVLHAGKMATDSAGNVIMDYLPAPVLGTFWPYSADKNVRLSAVTSSQRKVLVDRTALTVRELIEANIGASVLVTEMPLVAVKEAIAVPYAATILEVPQQSGEELEATSPPYSGEKLPQKGNIVLLKTDAGVRAVNIDRIVDVTFKAEPQKRALGREEFRNLLTLKLEWPDGAPRKEADVGMMYLQRGIRWIPNYRIAIDGKGSAVMKLQATLINELADMEDVTAHLVVGVPNFVFKDTVDPMSLQQQIAQLSQYFREDARTGNQFSNAIMTQSARMTEVREPSVARPTMDLGPELAGSAKSEDLFIYTVKHITLKKGQRMVVAVAEFTVPYQDAYTLDIPFAPPPELRSQIDNPQQLEIARLLAAPKVMHKLRITNKSEFPFTTAPAMIVRDERALAQSMLTYTAVGGQTDIELTAAVDVRVKKTDTETKRTPNATVWQGDTYGRVDLGGVISLTNFGTKPIEVEVVRHVLGNATGAGSDGKVEMVNVFEDPTFATGAMPSWWGYYSWPRWWYNFNGVGRITWTVTLEAGKAQELKYAWHYFWR